MGARLPHSIGRTREIDRANLLAELERDRDTLVPDGRVDVTNFAAQLGTPLTSQQVVERLRRCNPKLHFEVSHSDPTKMGVYILTSHEEKKFICGMEFGYMPEFSVRHTTIRRSPDPDNPGNWLEREVFERETRGWRTVLARLIRGRFITPTQAYSHFPLGRSSKNWHVLTVQ